MNKKILISLLVAMTSFLATTSVKAVDVKGYDLEIILDSSGSMAENLGGKSKMVIAKEAIQGVVNEVPDTSFMGFRAYGHQSGTAAKNCTDTQNIVPVGAINKVDFMSKVNALTPRGWTPIDYSLRQAQNDFSSKTEYGKMIILVSDGEETCGGDPCQAVKDLKAAGFNPIVNTVGFSVGAVAREQLKCIAAATGGEYKDASNAAELAESMRVFSKRAFQGYTTSGTVVAGTGFNNAPLVVPGVYGGDILPEETKFYKFSVLKGQDLGVSLSIKREKAIKSTSMWDAGCADFIPSIKIYDTSMAVIGENKSVGAEDIGEGDTSPHAYTIPSFKAMKSGEYFVALSNDWAGSCDASEDRQANQKKYPKAFYDMKITVEGAGEADPVVTATKVPNDANVADQNASANQSGGNTTRNIVIAIIVLLSLGGIGAVVFFVMKNKNAAATSTPITFSERMPQGNTAPSVAQASVAGEKFCTKCGTKNGPDKAFCVNCGGQL